jgi:hypothetical protein
MQARCVITGRGDGCHDARRGEPEPLIGLPHMKSGKLRAIGVTGLKRSPTLPDV